MRARDLIKGNITYHTELNPAVWDGDELRIDVRYKLLEIAKRFIEYLEVPEFKLQDVILRGSLVNYNYTAYSDFDLHIVTDFSTLDCDITEQFYMAKKRIWNDEHDITIRGHEVELYVEDVDAVNVSAGTYSVLNGKWLRIPKYDPPEVDERAVNVKARDLMTQITRAIRTGSIEDIERLQDKIKTMRQAGLDRAGEFSTENLAFKIIRNKGYLDRLYKNKNSKFDQELSLDENENYPKVDGGYEHNGLGYKQDKTTGKYPVHPLPRWNIFNTYSRNDKGSSMDILHYMTFLQDSYQTASIDISGDEIADTIAKLYNKNPQEQLKNFNSSQGLNFKSWHDVYQSLKEIKKDEMIKSLRPTYFNERKKSKKKKKRSVRRYPTGGYYGYYWGGYNDNDSDGGDGGGGGDGG